MSRHLLYTIWNSTPIPFPEDVASYRIAHACSASGLSAGGRAFMLLRFLSEFSAAKQSLGSSCPSSVFALDLLNSLTSWSRRMTAEEEEPGKEFVLIAWVFVVAWWFIDFPLDGWESTQLFPDIVRRSTVRDPVPVHISNVVCVGVCVRASVCVHTPTYRKYTQSHVHTKASVPLKPIMHIALPPISTKFIHFPQKFTFFGLIYVFIVSPYFDHGTFMHHALHVLDTPAHTHLRTYMYICTYNTSPFIHSDHFYSASLSPLIPRSAHDKARTLCRSFTPKRHSQLWVEDLPKVPTWWLERESNPRPSVESYRRNQCATTSNQQVDAIQVHVWVYNCSP